MAYWEKVLGVYLVLFLGGRVIISAVVSIWRLKPFLGKGCQTNSLPIGLNRISWKQDIADPLTWKKVSLPIGLNRISWKH